MGVVKLERFDGHQKKGIAEAAERWTAKCHCKGEGIATGYCAAQGSSGFNPAGHKQRRTAVHVGRDS